MRLAMILTGRIEFYDRPTAWGLILGDDGCLYVLRGRDLRGPAPRIGERVSFEAQEAAAGKRAVGVRIIARGLAPLHRDGAPEKVQWSP